LPLPPSLLQVCLSLTLLSKSALVHLTFCLLQLPFSLPFTCPSSSPCYRQRAVFVCSSFCLAVFGLLLLPAVRDFDQHVHAKPSSAFAAAKQYCNPSSCVSVALAASFLAYFTSSNNYSLFGATTCLPSDGQPISTDNDAFCRRVYHPNSITHAPCQLIHTAN